MTPMGYLLKRYTSSQVTTITDFFAKLAAATNKTGKMLESKKVKILQSWEPYPPEIVISALEVYLKMDIPKAQRGRGKNEKYVLGIIKNKAGEANAGRLVQGNGETVREDEGARLRALVGERKPTDDELKCEF